MTQPASGLLDLPTEILSLCLCHVPPGSIARFGMCSHTARSIAENPQLWTSLLQHVWYDFARPMGASEVQGAESAKDVFVRLAYGRLAEWRCCPLEEQGCGGMLTLGRQRCPCVGGRGSVWPGEPPSALPLVVACLNKARTGSSHLLSRPES